jgi:hypothetical protein
MDGTFGRIGKPDEEAQTTLGATPEAANPQAAGGETQSPGKSPPEQPTAAEPVAAVDEAKPGFREIKVALAGHLVPAKLAASRPRGRRRRGTTASQEKRPSLGLRKYAVHLGKPEVLFQMLLLLIYRMGLHQAKTLLVIADGAHWIWNGVKEHLAGLGVELVEILDYWHAVEHLWELARGLFGQGTRASKAWVEARKDELLKGGTAAFFDALAEAVAQARQTSDKAGSEVRKLVEVLELAESTLTYFRNNESRIQYQHYLARGFLIGSGATEGACKHLIKERVHRVGMRWSPEGCMSVLRNRTLIKNGDWDAFWREEARRRQARYTELKIRLGAAA